MENIKLTPTDLEVLNSDKLFFPANLLNEKSKIPEPKKYIQNIRPKNPSIFKPLNNGGVNTLNLGVNKKYMNFKLF
tara:strand:- start:2160 stop:2387 length:228 start_codon:yes stop_codon:yes gene_type:complete